MVMQSKWECPRCDKKIVSHVTGTKQVSHACSNYGAAVNFKRTARSKYDLMK